MRFLYLLLGMLSCLLAPSPKAHAQDTARVARPAAVATLPATPPPLPDTVAALHRLFAAKRSQRTVTVGGTLVASGVAIGLLVVNGPTYTSYPGYNQLLASLVVVATIPVVAGELAHFGKYYSRRQERRAIEAWRQHHLPLLIWQQLKPAYFQPASALPPGQP